MLNDAGVASPVAPNHLPPLALYQSRGARRPGHNLHSTTDPAKPIRNNHAKCPGISNAGAIQCIWWEHNTWRHRKSRWNRTHQAETVPDEGLIAQRYQIWISLKIEDRKEDISPEYIRSFSTTAYTEFASRRLPSSPKDSPP